MACCGVSNQQHAVSAPSFPPTAPHFHVETTGRNLPDTFQPRSSSRRHTDCPNVLVWSHSYLAIHPGLQCLGSSSDGFLSPASRLNAGGAIGNGSCVGVFVRGDDGRLRYTMRARTTEGYATPCTRGRRRAALHCTREDDERWRRTVRARTVEGGAALCAMGRMDDDTHEISCRRCDSFTSVDKRLMKSRSSDMFLRYKSGGFGGTPESNLCRLITELLLRWGLFVLITC